MRGNDRSGSGLGILRRGWRVFVVCAGVTVGIGAGAVPAWASIAAKPTSTWQTNGRVNAILDVGGITYLGGSFTQVSDHSGHSATVSNLAAFDSSGNLVPGWAPRANYAVKALTADGSNILAGGAFTTVNGVKKLHLALIAPSGAFVSFKGHTNKEVDALAVSAGVAYAGGTFTKANGAVRDDAAAFNAAGGALTSWNPSADGRVDAILPAASGILLGGMFIHLQGQYAGYLDAVDAASGTPIAWAAHSSAAVLGLAADNGSVFAAIGGRGGKVAAYAQANGSLLWQDQTDGNVQAITAAAGEVIPGGHFNNFCDLGTACQNPVARHKVAALNETTGAIDPSWHPYINSNLGVFAALGTASSLQIGGDFTKVAGVPQAHFASFSAS